MKTLIASLAAWNGCSRSGAIQVAEERSAEKSAPARKIPQGVESNLHADLIELNCELFERKVSRQFE